MVSVNIIPSTVSQPSFLMLPLANATSYPLNFNPDLAKTKPSNQYATHVFIRRKQFPSSRRVKQLIGFIFGVSGIQTHQSLAIVCMRNHECTVQDARPNEYAFEDKSVYTPVILVSSVQILIIITKAKFHVFALNTIDNQFIFLVPLNGGG